MKRVTIKVDHEVDVKFRKKASQKYQFEKGWYSKAVEDAMKLWIAENNKFSTNVSGFMDFVSPDSWEKLKSELNICTKDPFEDMEYFINSINSESDYDLKIKRERDDIIIELNNDHSENIENNLKTLMILHIILKIILSSLYETTKEKYVISGITNIPNVYISKLPKQ